MYWWKKGAAQVIGCTVMMEVEPGRVEDLSKNLNL
jgi:hypothetical protein